MKRVFRPIVLLLVSVVAVPAAVSSLNHASTTIAAAENGARDLAKATPESVGISSERLRRLDDGLRKFVDDHRLAGVTTLLARHGKIVHTDSYGKKDVRNPDPIQRDSIFRIYSMTKPITGVAMMMLYEEGKWRLDDPVSRYIPEFSKMQVYAGDNSDGAMRTEEARRSMTMRELMTHSAGLGYVLNQTHPVDRMIIAQRVLDPAAPLQAMITKLSKIPLLAQPGTRWSYSIAVDVQGYLVEKFSGQSFADFLKTRLFDPLGMKDTGFYVPQTKLGRVAMVHSDGRDGQLVPAADNAESFSVPPAGASGGGGLFSTSDDYLRFTQMLLNGGEFGGIRYLAPRTVEMMRTNHLSADALKTMRPGTGWGMDFRVVMDAAAAGEPVSDGSFDWYGIAGTWFWIDPKADLVFIGMIQSRGSANNDIRLVSRNLVYQAVTN